MNPGKNLAIAICVGVVLAFAACGSNSGGSDTTTGKDTIGGTDSGVVADNCTPDHCDWDPGGPDPVVDAQTDPGKPPEDIPGIDLEVAGEDTSAPDDGGLPVPAPHPLFDFTGKIEISERPKDGGGAESSGIGVLIWDAPPDTTHTLVKEEGGCQYWLALVGQPCVPDCEPDQYCGTDGLCRPHRDRVGAGTVSVTGTSVDVTVVPDDSDWYVTQGDTPDDLFGPGDAITVKATGDEVPAFQVSLPGVGDMLAPWALGSLTMLDGADLHLPWVVQGDGSTVELTLQTGWHGAPPTAIVWCSAPDDAGAITVPKVMVEAFPPAGGMGMLPHKSWVKRVSRRVVDGPYGPVEVKVVSQRQFSLIHNPW